MIDHTAIRWCTCEKFLYGMLNDCLRTLEIDAFIKLDFFIRHLYHQTNQLYQAQRNDHQKIFTVYRGQVEKLMQTRGVLISSDNFFIHK